MDYSGIKKNKVLTHAVEWVNPQNTALNKPKKLDTQRSHGPFIPGIQIDRVKTEQRQNADYWFLGAERREGEMEKKQLKSKRVMESFGGCTTL